MSAFDDENPFADPSVQRAVEGTGTANANLNDYNPFEAQKNATLTPASNETVSGVKPATTAPASTVINNGAPAPVGGPPPAYTASGQQQISTSDFQRRQEELDRRARDLERQEEELKRNRAQNYNVRQNNWPPLPSFCPFQPCFYQDINVDIPVEFQRIVRNIYYLWVAHAGLLFANMIAALVYLFCSGDNGQMFGLSLLYTAIFIPTSFVCWFRPAYKAFRDDSSFNFMLFFFVFFFQFLFSVIYALGIGNMGACGLIIAIKRLADGGANGIVSGLFMLIVGIGFALLALADFYCLVTIHKMYRSSGASMAKAQAEFASGVMRNEQVQAAAAAAARETVRSQFAGGAGGVGENHQAPRY